MPNIYVEPIPKGREGQPEGYVLELKDGKRLHQTNYQTQAQAIDAAKATGHNPQIARVRVTGKGDPDHWRSAD